MAEKIGLEAVFITKAFDAGLGAYTHGLATAVRVTAVAQRGINAIGQVAIGALRRLGELGVNGFLYAGRSALMFAQDIVRASLEGSYFSSVMDRVRVSLIQVAQTSLGPFFDKLAGMAEQAAPKVLGVVQAVTTSLGGMASNALVWGQNLVTQFANGMYQGFNAVVGALTGLGNLISGWLQPGSPPRILPNIDKWGASAMNEYIRGFTMADFGMFRELTGTVEGYLRSLSSGQDSGLIPSILGSREAIAAAIAQVREAGKVTSGALNTIIRSLGPVSENMRQYVEDLLRLELANKAVSDLEGQIRGLTDAQQALTEEASISRLELVLKDPNASARAKKMAQLEIDKLKTGGPLRAAQAEQAAAQTAFDQSKARVQIEIETNNLLKEQVSLLDSLIEKAAAVAKAMGGGGGGAVKPKPFAIDTAFIDDLKLRIGLLVLDIQRKLDTLRVAWLTVWARIKEAVQPFIDFYNNELHPLFIRLQAIVLGGVTMALGTMIGFWNDTVIPDLKTGKAWIEENVIPVFHKIWVALQVLLPIAALVFSAVLNNVLVPALKGVYGLATDLLLPALGGLWSMLMLLLPNALRHVALEVLLFKQRLWFLGEVIDNARDLLAKLLEAAKDLARWAATNIIKFTLQLPEIPSWLIPGSPTPFEMGLRGVAKELRHVAQISRGMQGLQMLPAPVSSPGFLGNQGGSSYTHAPVLNYQPQYSTPARGPQSDIAIANALLGSFAG